MLCQLPHLSRKLNRVLSLEWIRSNSSISKNPFLLLNDGLLSYEIDLVSIRQRYFDLQRQHHPDRPRGNSSTSTDLALAYETLRCPLRRAIALYELVCGIQLDSETICYSNFTKKTNNEKLSQFLKNKVRESTANEKDKKITIDDAHTQNDKIDDDLMAVEALSDLELLEETMSIRERINDASGPEDLLELLEILKEKEKSTQVLLLEAFNKIKSGKLSSRCTKIQYLIRRLQFQVSAIDSINIKL